jgi:processive 1,2-diacylglycerol beta-glucosyltransferase
MKKALFLSISTGYGHHMAAQNAMRELEEKGWQCEMLDAYGYISPALSSTISKGFLMSSKYAIPIYSKVYRMFELNDGHRPEYSTAKFTHKLYSIKLKKYIENFNPDVVVCTHVFAALMVSQIKERAYKTFGIITDFTIHPYWEDTNLDYYVIASEFLTHMAQIKQIDTNKLLPFGIPIAPKFSENISKTIIII